MSAEPTLGLDSSAGRDFDNWLDWNGSLSASDGKVASLEPNNIEPSSLLHLPISPSSTTNGDALNSAAKSSFLTAPPADILTPQHSSGSPDSRFSFDLRLSGDTLRDQPSPNERPMLKRKLSPTDIPTANYQPDVPVPAAKKRPHNVIEKKYRANLNAKIAELRDSVPSLRVTKKSTGKDGENVDSDDEDLDGLAPSNKLNKASVLTKAVEYIRHLEFRTKRLEDENKSLKERLETLDKVIARGGHDAQRAVAFTSDTIIEERPESGPATTECATSSDSPAPSNPPQGLVPLPDAWRRMRQNQSQEHYGHIYQTPAERSRFKGKWPTRIMLGSIAGLMIMDGLNEPDNGNESREKGLFGIPLELLDGWQFLRSPHVYLAAFTNFCRTGGVIPLMKGFVALTFLAFVVFSYLFNSKPSPKDDLEEMGTDSAQIPAPASPIQVRRRAWSTSMQALNLPHHSFFPEWLAITSEWLKYSFGYVFGPRAYAWLTGRTADDDAARIKAWDIAIDAQLAGGDIEVSRSRVVLTIFGSGTLPYTPLRLMLKALHVRVLLWSVGSLGTATSRVANHVGKLFARRQWRRAKSTQDDLAARDPDRLPRYLSELLNTPCDDVLIDTVCQRAYNLMYDRPTQEHSSNSLLDVVVEDHAVRSPLDAIAAWRSTHSLTQALQLSLRSPESTVTLQGHLDYALKVAPPGSAAETRALAASAVFCTSERLVLLKRVSNAVKTLFCPGTSFSEHARPPYFIDSSTPMSARADIVNCLHCAETLNVLEHEGATKAAAFYVSQPVDVSTANLLTRSVTKHLLRQLSIHGMPVAAGGDEVRNMPYGNSFDTDVLDQSNPKVPRRTSVISNDTGYESLDESISSWGFEGDVDANETTALQIDAQMLV
ncbi:hypothetical protein PV10_01908 [Exophiala mesophila]|uniref:BHLH domain-containing protein n=1 Tax=Exophiala mesophila TaxID=212818 RepID=A0A0D1YC13_EXOME|nr:uncharacterized protein PV10_01908 [Exophiala mesophila]KIV98241.1 hypothetical protein PV10_01908 [Exophiala mesophila]